MDTTDNPAMNDSKLPALLYFFGRLVTFLALIPDSYTGPGDLPEYMGWAGLPGWPYIHYWVEFPPLFPLINSGLYKLAGGQTFQYTLLLALVFALAGAVCVWAFRRVAIRTLGGAEARLRTWIYLALLLPLPYTWWYFDLLPLALLLLGTLWLLENHTWRSGLAVGAGMLLKWFPGFLLGAALRFRKPGLAGKVIAAALGLVLAVLGFFYLLGPEMTLASIRAQPSRSSWQTAWALLDGNMTTGAFLLLEDRLDPTIAGIPRGQPARIPSFLALPFFAALGAWLFWRVRSQTPKALVAFLGLTWLVFLTWSPGWSPQWILYLVPLVLLTLPFKPALYGAGGLILLALLEWPTLLAHAVFEALWLIVPLRLALFAWLGLNWYRQTRE